jgi:hypothetical protein
MCIICNSANSKLNNNNYSNQCHQLITILHNNPNEPINVQSDTEKVYIVECDDVIQLQGTEMNGQHHNKEN